MSSSGPLPLAEADLHGLVDGFIPPERRVLALRQLAASPGDRARVEAWQGQNDLLRNTFTAIMREPLPPMLDLKAKPVLRIVPANDTQIVHVPGVELPGIVAAPAPRRRLGAAAATFAVVAVGLCGSWLLLTGAGTERPVPGLQLRGPLDVALAARSNEAARRATGGFPPVSMPVESLPTTDIPDLRAAGFSFAGADTSSSRPISISFRYQNDKAERIVVTVATRSPADENASAALIAIGDAFAWHKGDRAYAIAGTIHPAKLRSLAVALLRDDTQ